VRLWRLRLQQRHVLVACNSLAGAALHLQDAAQVVVRHTEALRLLRRHQLQVALLQQGNRRGVSSKGQGSKRIPHAAPEGYAGIQSTTSPDGYRSKDGLSGSKKTTIHDAMLRTPRSTDPSAGLSWRVQRMMHKWPKSRRPGLHQRHQTKTSLAACGGRCQTSGLQRMGPDLQGSLQLRQLRALQLQLDARSVAADGLLRAPGLPQRIAQVVVCLREAGLTRDGLPVGGDRLLQLACGPIAEAGARLSSCAYNHPPFSLIG
jgi:hypothetical protein